MASRKRLNPSIGSPRHKRRVSLSVLMESLEARVLLSVNPNQPVVTALSPYEMDPQASVALRRCTESTGEDRWRD